MPSATRKGRTDRSRAAAGLATLAAIGAVACGKVLGLDEYEPTVPDGAGGADVSVDVAGEAEAGAGAAGKGDAEAGPGGSSGTGGTETGGAEAGGAEAGGAEAGGAEAGGAEAGGAGGACKAIPVELDAACP